MKGRTLFAVALLLVGGVILLYVFSTGGKLFSFAALLGALCLADGILRLLTAGHKER